jgi:hypothetical protein
MRFVGVLYSILTLAVAWKLFDHFENATGHKPTNCQVYGNKVSDLEFVGTASVPRLCRADNRWSLNLFECVALEADSAIA